MGEDVVVASSALVQFHVDQDAAIGMPSEGGEMVSFPLRIRKLLVVVVRMSE